MAFKNADVALQELLEGNQRYVADKSTHPRQTPQRRQELREHQGPFASILGCADSRVPPELIFDQGLGDLFVVRVAGNIVDEEAVLGSLEYAVTHLQTPLVMVLGHKACGAVKATVEAVAANTEGAGHLRYVVNAIRPAAAEGRLQAGNFLDNAIRANIHRTVKQLTEKGADFSAMVREQKLKIIGAYYDLESGQVELLDENVCLE
jgi:carbonic anhydrase